MESMDDDRRIVVADQDEEEDQRDAEVDDKVERFYALIRSCRELGRRGLRTESERFSRSVISERKKIKVTDGGVRGCGGLENSSIPAFELEDSDIIRRRMVEPRIKIGGSVVGPKIVCQRPKRTLTTSLLPCACASQSEGESEEFNGINQALDHSCAVPRPRVDDGLDLDLHL